jgi:16S rRNA (uracil1498-N3)-methyltransferase
MAIELSEEDSRHAVRSLRLRVGDRLTVSNNCGAVADGTLVSADRGVAMVELASVRHHRQPEPHLTVAMAPPKGDRLSWATQKLGELGVDELYLVTTERTVRTPEHYRALIRQVRVAREAAMQARRPFITFVHEERFRDDLVPRWSETRLVAAAGRELRLLLWERAETPIRAAWTDGPPEAVTVLIGPEGSFTDAEVALAEDAGFVPVSLGEGILRTETAAVVGAALVLARYGRLG